MHCSQDLGPVVQSVVSLTSSLRVISLTVLADSIYNIMIFFAEKMWVAFALHIWLSLDVNFNVLLTNDVISFEQLGPSLHQISLRFYSKGNNTRKGDKYIRQEKKMCQIFLEEIHIWNFKTLACRVLDERTRCTTWNQYGHQLLWSWGHKIFVFLIYFSRKIFIVVLIRSTKAFLIRTHNMFLWRNKKNDNTFGMKKNIIARAMFQKSWCTKF